jgi:hypothetical protein
MESDASAGDDASMTPDGGAIDDAAEGDGGKPSPPPTLSATGFFTGLNNDGSLKLATGVMEFQPKYALWSDGAEKKRWVYIPPGTKIDTTDPDHWSFPVGTKFWKEFALSGKRIETRLVERFGPGQDDFIFAAYWWQPTDAGTAATDAVLADPAKGIQDANGTQHDIPSERFCERCHGPLKEHALGFGALQLNHNLPGQTVKTLAAAGLFSKQLPANLEFPGANQVAKDAFGYLHANCGNCHNDSPGLTEDMLTAPQMYLRSLIGQAVADTGVYKTALNVPLTKFYHDMDPKITYRIEGGSPTTSCVSYRMAERGMDQMPPIATEIADTQGQMTVNKWIATLPPPK